MVTLKLFPKRESVQYEIIQSFYYSGVGREAFQPRKSQQTHNTQRRTELYYQLPNSVSNISSEKLLCKNQTSTVYTGKYLQSFSAIAPRPCTHACAHTVSFFPGSHLCYPNTDTGDSVVRCSNVSKSKNYTNQNFACYFSKCPKKLYNHLIDAMEMVARRKSMRQFLELFFHLN